VKRKKSPAFASKIVENGIAPFSPTAAMKTTRHRRHCSPPWKSASPTILPVYFPSKDAVLREVGRRAFARQAESLKAELSVKATTEQRLPPILRNSGKCDRSGATALAGCNFLPARWTRFRSPRICEGRKAATVSFAP